LVIFAKEVSKNSKQLRHDVRRRGPPVHHHVFHHEKEETPEDLKEEMKLEHASEGVAASAGVYALVI